MTCPVCNAWAPDDPETGYGADGLCPGCQAAGWVETGDGEYVNDRDAAEPEPVSEFDQVRR